MENFAIITDASADFTREQITKYGIEEVPMSTIVWPNGEAKTADIYWDTMTPDDYFSKMTNKKNIFTSSIPSTQTVLDRLEALAREGKNIICITVSSSMSGGYSLFKVSGDEIMKKYPNIKIEVVDSLRYSGAIALLAVEASLKRSARLSFEDTVKYLNEVKLKIHECGFLDDLFFLARKGRISKGVAFMGSMVGVKPMADLCNETGLSMVIGKARGYKKLFKIFPKYIQRTIGNSNGKTFVITYSLREKQALEMKALVEQYFKPEHLIYVPMGQSTGANVGPGLCAAFYAGDENVSPNCVKEIAILGELLK